MIEMTQPLTSVRKSLGRRPACAEMTNQQTRQEAQRLLFNGMTERGLRAVDLLATAGILSVAQLDIHLRTLQRLSSIRILDRVPYTIKELELAFDAYGLPGKGSDVLLYTLGPVGIEIAKQRHKHPPLTGYLAYPLQRVLHDVALNEIVLKLVAFGKALGWTVDWLSHYEATLYSGGEAILEPDALLALNKDGREKHFLIEYHNEDKQTRAYGKVRKYEAAFSTDVWRSQWDTEIFPAVLAVFRLPIVGQGYQHILKEREQVHCTYYGKRLSGVLDGNLDEWHNIGANRRESLFGRDTGEAS